MSDEELRLTKSGIQLPEPDPDKGHPIAIAQTDVPGLIYNFAAPTADDVRAIAEKVFEAKRRAASGEDVTLEFIEPQFGQVCYLDGAGAAHIVSVVRGWAPKVDPLAEQRLQLLQGPPMGHLRPRRR